MNDHLIYEVELSVDPAIRQAFGDWLKPHMAEVCAAGQFLGARCLRDSETGTYIVQYDVPSQAHLDTYLATHAPRLRADALSRFSDQFTAKRRVLNYLY